MPAGDQLSCQELVELVTSYLEGALSEEDRVDFDRHLELCDGCRTYVEQLRSTVALSGRLEPEALAAETERALLAAFRDWKTS